MEHQGMNKGIPSSLDSQGEDPKAAGLVEAAAPLTGGVAPTDADQAGKGIESCGSCDVCERAASGMAESIARELSGAYEDDELLRLEYEMLLDDFIDAVFEFEDITLRINPLTEARYSVSIGVWERGLSK